MASSKNAGSVEAGLRLGHGLETHERPRIVETFKSLDRRLQSFPLGSVELLLTVKERDTPSQRVTLQAWIAHHENVVAHSTRPEFASALIEVRDDLIKQITDNKNQTEARNTRRLRKDIKRANKAQ